MQKTLFTIITAFLLLVAGSAHADIVPTVNMFSSRARIAEVQNALNQCTDVSLKVDGVWGWNTKTAVMQFQSEHGIQSVGYVGINTAGALNDCINGGNYEGWDTTPNPIGNPCYLCCNICGNHSINHTNSHSNSHSSGGSGELDDVDILSTYENEEVSEGDDDVRVMAFELSADDESDLTVRAIRLSFEMTGNGNSHMDQYMTEVKIWESNHEVASVDVDDFSENNDVYTKLITIDDVDVDAGDSVRFYVTVSADSSIDSDDLGEDWTLTLDSVRFEDEDENTSTDSQTGELGDDVTFSFEN